MSISLYSQSLAAFPAQRAKALNAACGVDAVYALVWPEYEPPIEPLPARNRAEFKTWRTNAGVPLWAWVNCHEDQEADVARIRELDASLAPNGYLLDIEGQWTKGASLKTLITGVTDLGKPVRASLAASTSSHVEYDYRTLDLQGVDIEWQCYFDSGEGPLPSVAVRELHRASFVIPGWLYRHRWNKTYGWGRVTDTSGLQATYDSFKRVGAKDATFDVSPRAWGVTVDTGILRRGGLTVGQLMGRAAYTRIRVALDVTRSAQARPAQEWVPIAASARVPGASKRPCSVYMAENTTDAVIEAIATGSG